MDSVSLLILLGTLILVPVALAGCSLAPWVPTRKKDFSRINALVQLKPGAVFYDLGCGEGRVCRYIAAHNPDVHVIGIELAFPLYSIARLLQAIRPLKNLTYIHGNALNRDLSDADAIYVYALIDTINKKLQGKFLAELRAGARVVSYHFRMKDWPGMQSKDEDGKRGAVLHVYEVE